MVIYDRKDFTSIKTGHIVFFYEWMLAVEYSNDYGYPEEKIPVLTEVIITTKPGHPERLTGWGVDTELADPTKDEIKAMIYEEFSYFFRNARMLDFDLKHINRFSHVEVLEGPQYSKLKKIIIRSV